MNSDLVAHSNHLADRRGSHDETTLRDRSANSAAPRLTRRASLMLTLVLSPALWTAVWVATGLCSRMRFAAASRGRSRVRNSAAEYSGTLFALECEF